MSSCVPGFEQLTRWSGQACALWGTRAPEEKRQWVQNYFQAHGFLANDAYVATLVSQMDASCSIAPAGSLYDGLNEGFGGDSQDNSNQPSEGYLIATDPNFNRTVQTGINAIGNTTLGIVQSNNRTNYGYPNNNAIGTLGGYPTGTQNGIYGGVNSRGVAGFGSISWTPIIIGGVIVLGLGAFLIAMSNRRS